jgi:hypothetical protein
MNDPPTAVGWDSQEERARTCRWGMNDPPTAVGGIKSKFRDYGTVDLTLNYEWNKGEYRISTAKHQLDLDVIYGFLSQSYWAAGRSIETVRRSIDNSLAFGLYSIDKQVGFARVVTDFATFAWLADVFVLKEARDRGLGVWLLRRLFRIQSFRI